MGVPVWAGIARDITLLAAWLCSEQAARGCEEGGGDAEAQRREEAEAGGLLSWTPSLNLAPVRRCGRGTAAAVDLGRCRMMRPRTRFCGEPHARWRGAATSPARGGPCSKYRNGTAHCLMQDLLRFASNGFSHFPLTATFQTFRSTLFELSLPSSPSC